MVFVILPALRNEGSGARFVRPDRRKRGEESQPLFLGNSSVIQP